MGLVRHFTATGFVVHEDQVALHWHPKVQAWLPPGGHIMDNEDPVQAVIREINEESGLEVDVVPTGLALSLEYPTAVDPPLTIMVEDIHDPAQGYHQHIDMIYVCRPRDVVGPLNDGWCWVGKEAITAGTPLERDDGISVAPPDDVRVLALRAFDIVAAQMA